MGRSEFTPDEIKQAWTLYNAGYNFIEIASRLGRSESGVRRIVNEIIRKYNGDVDKYIKKRFKIEESSEGEEEEAEVKEIKPKRKGRKTKEEEVLEKLAEEAEGVEKEELKEALKSAAETAKSKKGKAATVIRAMTEKKVVEEATENVAFALHYGTFINKYVKPLAHANNVTVTDYLAEAIAFYELYKDSVEMLKLKAELYKELLALALEALMPENVARRKALMIKDLIMSLAAKGYQIPKDLLNEYLKVVKGG